MQGRKQRPCSHGAHLLEDESQANNIYILTCGALEESENGVRDVGVWPWELLLLFISLLVTLVLRAEGMEQYRCPLGEE